MNKAELIRRVAEDTGLKRKDTEAVINAALRIMTETLAEGERVQLVGFGGFEVKERAARMGRNLRTGTATPIPPSRGIQFTAGKTLKEAVRKEETP